MSTTRFRRILWLGAISIACVVGLMIYTWPSGTGEYQHTPDQRYRADAKALQRRTLTGKQIHYLEFQVESTADQTVIWQATYYPATTDEWIDYGDRSIQFIHWNDSNTAVSFTLPNQRVLTVPVP
ncbi:hypothetical protein [Nostoc sp. MG11]|uniref:hypothetical protein n=1 Tax=Nostoc sp. MG11 TaxID=2721166 RepID=UPI001866B60A|nr:hypothetical protein [Nostoc sp. MG11]